MKHTILCVQPLCVLVMMTFATGLLRAQESFPGPASLEAGILRHDSVFWAAYNACDVATMESYFTEDIEFYHDKAGLTTTRDSLFASIRKGLCGNSGWRLRREPVPGSLQVFPLNDYGAILSGEHVFYLTEKGKDERLDGRAKFTHVWRLREGNWRMHRVLSYDHGPATRESD